MHRSPSTDLPARPRRFRPWLPLLAATLLGLAGCAAPRTPYTEADLRGAQPVVPNSRTFGDALDPRFAPGVRTAFARRDATYLALSGGGGDGAFGAGILNGWSESGRRPRFTVVSGVSTGALIAPFAFLGSAYDPVLKEIYTSGIAESLLQSPDPFRALLGSSVFSDERLRELVARYVTPELLAEIAAERTRGRYLFVVTTNLDAQRPVLWDLGLIAAEGTPRSQQLFRDTLVASASIPAVFPPVLIDATKPDGGSFQEMHVDGTITTSVFTLPRGVLWSDRVGPRVPAGTLYVLMNAKVDTDFQLVANTTAAIGSRSVATLIKNGSRADLVATWRAAQARGIGFNVAAIGPEMQVEGGAGFDTAYMRRLYANGEARGRTGRFWASSPPRPLSDPTVAAAGKPPVLGPD